MDKKYLDSLIGKLVVFFYDDNGKLITQKGKLWKLDDDVAYFLTKKNLFIAELNFIKMIKTVKES